MGETITMVIIHLITTRKNSNTMEMVVTRPIIKRNSNNKKLLKMEMLLIILMIHSLRLETRKHIYLLHPCHSYKQIGH